MNKPRAINGLEEDATYAKKWFHWRPGERKKIKQAMNRRFRRQARQELASE
nr:hypothetical protein GCM10025732_47910 [Glycomyces mayteni]